MLVAIEPHDLYLALRVSIVMMIVIIFPSLDYLVHSLFRGMHYIAIHTTYCFLSMARRGWMGEGMSFRYGLCFFCYVFLSACILDCHESSRRRAQRTPFLGFGFWVVLRVGILNSQLLVNSDSWRFWVLQTWWPQHMERSYLKHQSSQY